MKYFVFAVTVLLFLISCKESKKTEAPIANKSDQIVEYGPEVPGITEEVMINLLNHCTYIDYIFKDLPFSVSQGEDPSIDQNIRFIDITKPVGRIPKHCKPIARKFFQINGEIVYDADLYFSKDCTFYVFVDKQNKPLFANYLTTAGIDFYNKVFQQASNASKNLGQ
ncbi:MAG: hypothetical protein R2774_08055 [Saprospiraceae bacterium]